VQWSMQFFFYEKDTHKEIRTVSKKELLKSKYEGGTDSSYYCKNDTCVYTDFNYKDHLIVFPKENGGSIKYITDTCTYDKIKSNECKGEKCMEDSQCLSNKCIDNYCAFNDDETPVVRCDKIYQKTTWYCTGGKSYVHCGKPYGNTCKTGEECSSNSCYDQVCSTGSYDGPTDSDNLGCVIFSAVIGMGLLILGIIIGIYLCCYCCYKKFPNHRKLIIVAVIIFTIILIIYVLFVVIGLIKN